MVVKRLTVSEAAIAKAAIEKLKCETPAQVREDLNTHYLREFLSCERNYFLAALIDGQPVGFILAYRLMRVDQSQDMMLFYEIVVDEKERNRGVGTLLISELKEICRHEKIMKMWVNTNRSNLAAMALYRQTGGIEDACGDEATFTYFPDFE